MHAAGGGRPALAEASASGQWTAPFPWPIVAIHMILLPDGRVLSMSRTGKPTIWDPTTGVFTTVPAPANLFCSGHTLLADGRVFVAGGHITDNHGLPNTTLFDPVHNTWQSSALMAKGRWYPTTTTLGNGDVLILAGKDQSATVVTTPEVWSNGSLQPLTTALKSLPYYPRAFLTLEGHGVHRRAGHRDAVPDADGHRHSEEWTEAPRPVPGVRLGGDVR